MMNPVWVLAALALLATAVAVSVLFVPRRAETNDPWARVSWGKFFVAIVYASIAAVCIVAIAHTAVHSLL